jgi:poly(A) polymerase
MISRFSPRLHASFLSAALLALFLCGNIGLAADLFTPEVNRLIDKDYEKVTEKGYGNLVLPARLHNISESDIPPEAVFVAKKLQDAGFTAYFVGGGVRDTLMGKHVNDWDITTSADYSDCEAVFGDMFFLHYAGDTAYGAVKLPDAKEPVDVATYGKIPAVYLGRPDVPNDSSRSLFNDSFRRDLTYNALLYDPKNGDVIDYHGGLRDMREHITDSVYEPTVQFPDNPSVCIRALRFTARFGFRMSPRLEKAMEHAADYLRMIPMNERYYNSARFFTDGYAARSYELLDRCGVMPLFLPGLSPAENSPEGIAAYKKYLETLMPRLDATDLSAMNAEEKQAYVYAYMLYPELRKLSETMPTETAVRTLIARQNKIMLLSDHDKSLLEAYLHRIFARL